MAGEAEPLLKICEDCPSKRCETCPVHNSPERYRKKERNEKWKVAAVITAVTIGAGVIGLLVALEFASLSIQSSVQNAQQNHSATLLALKSEGNEILGLTKEIKGFDSHLVQGNATVTRILAEAGTLSTDLLNGQAVSHTELAQILTELQTIIQRGAP